MTFTRWIRVSTPSFLRRVVDEYPVNTSFRVVKNDWQRGRYKFRAYLSHTLYLNSYVNGYCCSVTFVWSFGDTTLAWVTTVLSDAIFVFLSCETARSVREKYKVVGESKRNKRNRFLPRWGSRVKGEGERRGGRYVYLLRIFITTPLRCFFFAIERGPHSWSRRNVFSLLIAWCWFMIFEKRNDISERQGRE